MSDTDSDSQREKFNRCTKGVKLLENLINSSSENIIQVFSSTQREVEAPRAIKTALVQHCLLSRPLSVMQRPPQ